MLRVVCIHHNNTIDMFVVIVGVTITHRLVAGAIRFRPQAKIRRHRCCSIKRICNAKRRNICPKSRFTQNAFAYVMGLEVLLTSCEREKEPDREKERCFLPQRCRRQNEMNSQNCGNSSDRVMCAVGAFRKEPHNANITPQSAAFAVVYQMFRAQAHSRSLSLVWAVLWEGGGGCRFRPAAVGLTTWQFSCSAQRKLA